ncbi:MAG: histidine phosphatase family protein [Acidimicrobiales bacterium]
MVRRLLVIRHGQSEWNAQGRWQGWADTPLSDLGRAQAAEAVAGLAGRAWSAVVSSDLGRAVETAQIIAAALDLGEVEIDPQWRERNVGHWSGLTRTEIATLWPDELAAWNAGRIEATPGGENEVDFLDRAMGAAKRVAARPGTGEILVVSHGGVIRALDRALGVDSTPVGNLGGRWYSLVVDPAGDGRSDLVAGDPLDLAAPSHRTTSASP